jgi:hypothetical protein
LLKQLLTTNNPILDKSAQATKHGLAAKIHVCNDACPKRKALGSNRKTWCKPC